MNTTNPSRRRLAKSAAIATLCIVTAGLVASAHAESVMKMSFSSAVESNMRLQNGVFSMLSDGAADTPGDHNMSIDYLFSGGHPLSALASGGNASLTLSGMAATTAPATNGSFMVQAFDAGSLAVFGADHTLLLEADLIKSGLQGALGPGDKQGLFLGFGEVTGGTLARYLDPASLQLRIKFPKITDGFAVSAPPERRLSDFTTWTSSVEILAIPIPEPATVVLLLAAAALLPTRRIRRG